MAIALPAQFRGLPAVRQTCIEGDPACDFDPTPGTCRFHVWACVGGADPRLNCAASQVASVDLTRPGPLATGIPGTVRDVFLAAFSSLGFPVGPEEACTQRVDVDVPAGRRLFLIRSRSQTATGVKDRDILRLRCKLPK